MVFFILNEKPYYTDAVLADAIPPQSKQVLMKDMKIIELLTDIIHYPFELEIVELKTLKKKEP